MWQHGTERAPGGPVKILFVGGDLVRKGGDLLIQAFLRLVADPDLPASELHLVTRSEVTAAPGIVVHRLGPNSPELVDLYGTCHVFCLPSRPCPGDWSPRCLRTTTLWPRWTR